MRPSSTRPPIIRLHRRSLGIAAAAALLGRLVARQPRGRAAARQLPDRVEHLRRLDAVGLRRSRGHRQEMGGQVRHQHRGRPDQRLRRVDQSLHGRVVRRRHADQHGRAHDSGCRRRGHDRADSRQHLERQRRHRAQRRQRPRGDQRARRESRRALGIALPARAGARKRRAHASATCAWSIRPTPTSSASRRRPT